MIHDLTGCATPFTFTVRATNGSGDGRESQPSAQVRIYCEDDPSGPPGPQPSGS